MVALVCLGTIINYLSRNALGVMAPTLLQVLHFGAKEYSYVVGAFQLAYTAMQPVCGWVLDKMGLRAGYALFAVLWSIAGLSHALAGGWGGLAVARAGLGAAESVAIPGGMKAVAEHFGVQDRSKAVGWFNAGTSLGAMLAPPLCIFLMTAYGWRAAFAAVGLLGLVWAALWFALYRSPPGARAASGLKSRLGWRGVLTARRFWAIAVPRFLAEPAWQTFNFWIPLYLAHERHLDLAGLAAVAWAPFLAADLGGLTGGYLSPALVKRLKLGVLSTRWLSAALGAFLMIAPGFAALAGSTTAAVALLCIGGFAHQLISVTLNTLSADLFGSRELGLANGMLGSAGWIGGLGFSLLIGQVVTTTGYGPLFAAISIFDLVGAIWLGFGLRGLRLHEGDA